MKVVVHIDRLVLDGLAAGPGEAARVRCALERELGRQLREAGGVRAGSGGASPSLVFPRTSVPRQGTPEDIGRQVARTLRRGLEDGRR